MIVRIAATCLVLSLASGSCQGDTAPPPASQATPPAAVPAAPLDSAPSPGAEPVITAGACRCIGVLPDDPWLPDAEATTAHNLLRGPDLPLGWTAVGDAVPPDVADPMWLHAITPRLPACASLQLYDTPPGRVRVLIIAFKDKSRIPLLGAAYNSSRPKGMAPVAVGGVYVLMMEPDIAELPKQWLLAAQQGGGGPELMTLSQIAEAGDLAAFDAAAAAYQESHPGDAMPQAWRAGMLIKRGDLKQGREAARGALERAQDDPQAEAEALHWLYIAEYLLQSGPQVTLPLADGQVAAARRSGSRRQIVRALYDRACARAVGGDAQGALDDLRDCLQREATIGRTEYRDTAPSEPDFAALRETPGFKALLAR